MLGVLGPRARGGGRGQKATAEPTPKEASSIAERPSALAVTSGGAEVTWRSQANCGGRAGPTGLGRLEEGDGLEGAWAELPDPLARGALVNTRRLAEGLSSAGAVDDLGDEGLLLIDGPGTPAASGHPGPLRRPRRARQDGHGECVPSASKAVALEQLGDMGAAEPRDSRGRRHIASGVLHQRLEILSLELMQNLRAEGMIVRGHHPARIE